MCTERSKEWRLHCPDDSVTIFPTPMGNALGFDSNAAHERGDVYWCASVVEEKPKGTIADYHNPYEIPPGTVIGDGPFLDKTPDEVRAMLKPEPMDIPAIKGPANLKAGWATFEGCQYLLRMAVFRTADLRIS